MGTCTCARREFPDAVLSPHEVLLSPYEESLGISHHSVTTLVTGLNEVAAGGYITKPRFQIYLRIYELNLGSLEDMNTPRGKFLKKFMKRDGFDKEKLTDLMVLLGKGEDTIKADALFWSHCSAQELTGTEVRSILQSLTTLAYILLPQFAMDAMSSSARESEVSTLEKDINILQAAQPKVIAYWERTLLAEKSTLTLTQFRSGFGTDQYKPLCSAAALRQFGRDVDKLPPTT